MYRTTLYTCSVRRGPPTRLHRVYPRYSSLVSIRLFQSGQQALGPLVRSVDGPSQGPLEPWFLLYSRLVFRSSCVVYDHEAIWWCPSSPTPSTGGSMALLALWIRALNAQSSSTSQSRQTRPGAELSGPVCTPHLVVAFQLFCGGRRPVAR